MNILKTKKLFTYMVVGALVMALSISCKSNEDPKTEEKTFASYAGTWWGDFGKGVEEALIIINTDGSMVMYDSGGRGSDIPVSSTSIKKNSDISYTATVTAESGTSEQYIFTFSSDTQGKYEQIGGGVSASIPITKK